MVTVAEIAATPPSRPVPRPKHLLMCPPVHFEVAYRINPWMHPGHPVDRAHALTQWQNLYDIYRALGHRVDLVEPARGLPDMVYAANSALVLDGTAFLARFRHPERRGEEPAYARWFHDAGLRVVRAQNIHEGEGDFAVEGDVILAATGFRTAPAAHAEAAEVFDREVVSLHLVDPRFYHLDTALCVLSPGQIMYHPDAFTPASQAVLRRRYPDAVIVGAEHALAFGLNAASDGENVVLPAAAAGLAPLLRQAGYTPLTVDLSELRAGGGSVKCCTLELRS
jgi:N-dimethylarginine dimethylaminohydrolase